MNSMDYLLYFIVAIMAVIYIVGSKNTVWNIASFFYRLQMFLWISKIHYWLTIVLFASFLWNFIFFIWLMYDTKIRDKNKFFYGSNNKIIVYGLMFSYIMQILCSIMGFFTIKLGY